METPSVSTYNPNHFYTPKSSIPTFLQQKNEIVDSYIVDGVCLERVKVTGRRAIVYRRNTNIAFRRYEVDFDILNAVYVSFPTKEPGVAEVHLCLVGEWRIEFHELEHEGHCMLTLPFKICMAHRCGFGLLLERDCFSNSCEIEPDSAQLFSLTHPYNEFFPVVSKFRGDTQCHYAFRGRRIALISDSWHLNHLERCETIAGYDFQSRKKSVFRLRSCTKEEKNSAKNEMWMDARGFFNISTASPMSTAAPTTHSFLSPNFFNTKFLQGCRTQQVALPAHTVMENISPLTTQTSFASIGSGSRVSFGGVSYVDVAPNSGGASSSARVTPVRRHGMQTRSMAAAHSIPRLNMAAAPIANRSTTSLGGTSRRIEFISADTISGSDQVFSNASTGHTNLQAATSMASLVSSADISTCNRRRSNSNALLQLALTQQRRLRCTSTPITDLKTERLLSFGNATSMECAVEFCLEWIEDIQMAPDLSMDCTPIIDNARLTTPTISQPNTITMKTGALFSTAKKPTSTAIMERRNRHQQLQMLDDLLLNKTNGKCNSIHAWKLRESSETMLETEEGRYCRQRWGDNRLQNVRQMLDSSKAALIPSKLDALIESGDTSPSAANDERAQQMQFIMTTALKTVTRPFGQALLSFATVRPIANQPFVLNPICLSGKISPNGMQIEYPVNEPSSKNFIEWASFYNGVAHGLAVLGFDSFTRHCMHRTRKTKSGKMSKDGQKKLRHLSLSMTSGGNSFSTTARRRQSMLSDYSVGSVTTVDSDNTQVTQLADELANFSREARQPNSTRVVLDWDWLNMNLQAHRVIPPVEAGFLFAAGLSGHIPITNHDVYNYVANYKNKFCVMAILLGWAVAHRGTSDIVVHKVLITHSPFLMQPTLCDFRFEPMIQTAALIGLGFLFAETMNLSLSSQLVNQMSRETFDTEQGVADRYSFVLAAGFAVGLINLGKGTIIMQATPPVASAHLFLAERLVKLLNGGERRQCYVHYDRVHSGCDSSCANGVDGGNDIFRRYADGTTTTGEGPLIGEASERALNSTSCHVRQMSRVNIHLASPAACAALALLYLRTNDAWISDALSISDTMPAIERIRPDVLMLRVLAKCLVNFDSIGVSMKFVEAQIPPIICRYALHFVNNCNGASKEREAWWSRMVDVNCVAQAYFYCSAGACMAIALRYASTGDLLAKATIESFYYRVESEALPTDENNSVDMFRRLGTVAGKNCINACINVCAISLALVMAGSGDLATLRLLRKIRNLRRPDSANANASTSTASSSSRNAVLHSLHTATNMAIGMLFLGNGRLSLDKSDMSIASLFISLFPIFPQSLLDNRAYLQPLRFLWTLAVETRFLTTVDADTLAPITVSIRITFKCENQAPMCGWTPFILPPLNQIATMTLSGVSASVNDRKTIGDAVHDYVPVELSMRNARDARKLSDVLNRCYGRLPMRRKMTNDLNETFKPEDLGALDKLVGDVLEMLKSQKFGLEDELLSDDRGDAMEEDGPLTL